MRDFRVKWGILEEKTRDLRLNGGFTKRKRDFRVTWGICEEKMRDFRVKWRICKEKTCDFLVEWRICEEKTRDFRLNGGCSKIKRDFHLNVVFLKRKHVIFA